MIFLLAEKPTQNFEEKTQLLSHIFSFITIASKFGKNPHFHLKPHSLHYLRPPSFSFSGEKRSRKTEEARFSPTYIAAFSSLLFSTLGRLPKTVRSLFRTNFSDLFYGEFRRFTRCRFPIWLALSGSCFRGSVGFVKPPTNPAALNEFAIRWEDKDFPNAAGFALHPPCILEEEETVPIFHLSLFPHCCLTTKEKKITDDDPFVRPKKSRLLKKSKIGRGPWSPENFGKLIYAPGRFAAAVMDVKTAPPSPKPLGELFRGRTTLIFPPHPSRKILGDSRGGGRNHLWLT